MNNKAIITDSTLLAEDYIPIYIREREQQIKWLLSALFPAARGRKPVNIWLCGKPGTGRTCVSRFVLKKLKERWENIRGLYVNCWKYNTLYSLLDQVMKEFRILGGETTSTSGKLDKFLEFVRGRPFIMILDEIDAPTPKDRNSILYALSRTGNVGIICISRSEETCLKLDERVRSRLSARVLEFEEYNADQLLSILTDRASHALRVGSYKDDILRQIADLAQGDARTAIEGLKATAECAESEGITIGLEHVHRSMRNVKQSRAELALGGLTQHHRIIYNIIREKPDIVSGDLWGQYVDVCKKSSQPQLARRTFSAYVERLENLQLIVAEKIHLMGKVRKFRAIQ